MYDISHYLFYFLQTVVHRQWLRTRQLLCIPTHCWDQQQRTPAIMVS